MRLNFFDCLAIVGLGLIVAGVWRWSSTAGLITLGVMCFALAWKLDNHAPSPRRKEPR